MEKMPAALGARLLLGWAGALALHLPFSAEAGQVSPFSPTSSSPPPPASPPSPVATTLPDPTQRSACAPAAPGHETLLIRRLPVSPPRPACREHPRPDRLEGVSSVFPPPTTPVSATATAPRCDLAVSRAYFSPPSACPTLSLELPRRRCSPSSCLPALSASPPPLPSAPAADQTVAAHRNRPRPRPLRPLPL